MDFAAARTRMVERLVRSRYIQDSRVRDAFLAVPREAFVRPEDANDAYADVPLPIGRGQTISAPSMIAIMLEEAQLAPGDRVLEIGTGWVPCGPRRAHRRAAERGVDRTHP